MNADYHVHSVFSEDCEIPLETMIQGAIDKGLDEICFTEHMDLGVPTCINCDCDAFKAAFYDLKEKYADRITMRFGMEYGMQVHTIEPYQQNFNTYDYDFIIMSCHQVDNLEFCRQGYQQGRTQMEYNMGYYEEILRCVQQYKDYSIVGHLDMVCRYDMQGILPFKYIKDIAAEIMKQAISDGKGIEVNTSSFRYKLPDLTPSRDLLMLYRDLGGEVLTLGSDAHAPYYIAHHFDEVRTELREMGFKRFCTFEKMKPIWHTI